VLWIVGCTAVGVGHVDVVDVATLEEVAVPVLDAIVVTALVSIGITVIVLTLMLSPSASSRLKKSTSPRYPAR
jgi:multisubunit Na+/H+ antiporter MnhC subunit